MNTRLLKAGGVAGACAVAGAAAGIAGSAAAPSHKSPAAKRSAAAPPFERDHGPRGLLGGPPVHAEAVVPNRAGTGFTTVTMDAGKVDSVSGDQLTITEGTKHATYKKVKLTIPSAAKVRRNHATAKLADLKPGDRVRVITSSEGTFVLAEDAAHAGRFDGRGRRDHDGRGRFPGPPPGDAPDGPPPGF